MADGKNTDMDAFRSTRFELRNGKWGAYFHDTERGGSDGSDLPLDEVLSKLNRMDEYTKRLAKANKGRKNTF